MKKIILSIFILSILIISCKRKADLYINGKPFYISERCIKDTSWTEWGYHYGLSYRGKMEFHYGPQSKSNCLVSVIDTIEIK